MFRILDIRDKNQFERDIENLTSETNSRFDDIENNISVLTEKHNVDKAELFTAINTEKARAEEAEANVLTDAKAYTNDLANGQVKTNTANIAKEKSRAEGVEANFESRIATMETFFKGADIDASKEFIDTLKEIQSYIDSDKSGASSMLAAIQENTYAIETEEQRAKDVESDHNDRINIIETRLEEININSDIDTLIDIQVRISDNENAISAIKDGTAIDSFKDVEETISGKADKSTTLAGYNIDNAYTKNEVDNKISTLISGATTYTNFKAVEDWITSSVVEPNVKLFDTVAAMRTATDIANVDLCITRGYYSANDGGGAVYEIIDTVSDSTDIRCVALADGRYAVILHTNNVLCYGMQRDTEAYCDDILTKMLAINQAIYFPGGTYKFKNKITTKFDIVHDEHITFIFDGDGFEFGDKDASTPSNYKVVPAGFNNITIVSPSVALRLQRKWDPASNIENTISNCTFNGAVYLENIREMTISNCLFEGDHNQDCLTLYQCMNIIVNGCMFASKSRSKIFKRARSGIRIESAHDDAYNVVLNETWNHRIQCEGITISNCVIFSVKTGIWSITNTLHVTITGCVIDQCEDFALSMNNSLSLTLTDCYFAIRTREEKLSDLGLSSVTLEPCVNLITTQGSQDICITNCRIRNGLHNIKLLGLSKENPYKYIRIRDCEFETAENKELDMNYIESAYVSGGTFYKGVNDGSGINNTYHENSFYDSADFWTNSDSPMIYNNAFYGSSTIQIGSANPSFHDNVVETIGDIIFGDENPHIYNNKGYLTENRGIITIENTDASKMIYHGLVKKPNFISVTPISPEYNVKVDVIVHTIEDAFFVVREAHENSEAYPITVSWMASCY